MTVPSAPPEYTEITVHGPTAIPINSLPEQKRPKNVLVTTQKAIVSLFVCTVLIAVVLAVSVIENGGSIRLIFAIVPTAILLLLILTSAFYGIEKKKPAFIIPLIILSTIALAIFTILSISYTVYSSILVWKGGDKVLAILGLYIYTIFTFAGIACIVYMLQNSLKSRRIIIEAKDPKYQAVDSS